MGGVAAGGVGVNRPLVAKPPAAPEPPEHPSQELEPLAERLLPRLGDTSRDPSPERRAPRWPALVPVPARGEIGFSSRGPSRGPSRGDASGAGRAPAAPASAAPNSWSTFYLRGSAERAPGADCIRGVRDSPPPAPRPASTVPRAAAAAPVMWSAAKPAERYSTVQVPPRPSTAAAEFRAASRDVGGGRPAPSAGGASTFQPLDGFRAPQLVRVPDRADAANGRVHSLPLDNREQFRRPHSADVFPAAGGAAAAPDRAHAREHDGGPSGAAARNVVWPPAPGDSRGHHGASVAAQGGAGGGWRLAGGARKGRDAPRAVAGNPWGVGREAGRPPVVEWGRPAAVPGQEQTIKLKDVLRAEVIISAPLEFNRLSG